MKFFKKLAVLCAAITLCVGVGASLAACGGDEGDSSSIESSLYVPTTPHADGYDFHITVPEGASPTDYAVQLCDTSGSCIQFMAFAENGYLNYNPAPLDKTMTYEVHIMEKKNGSFSGDSIMDSTEYQITKDTIPANYTGAIIEVIITK